MPQKVIQFKGVNRRINEFRASGECEELINLRSDAGGLSVVKSKSTIFDGSGVVSVYEHAFGDKNNLIVITEEGIIKWIDTENKQEQTLSEEFGSAEIGLSSVANILVAYSTSEQKQLVFKFEDDGYKDYNLSLPLIEGVSIDYDYDIDDPTFAYYKGDTALVNGDIAFQEAVAKFYGEHPNGLCGASIIGCTYELEDGTEIWSTAFIVADITRYEGYKKPTYDNTGIYSKVYGASEVMLNLAYDDRNVNEFKRFNIYATRPAFKYTAEYAEGAGTNGEDIYVTKENELSDSKLDGQLMYYQGSIELGQTSLLLNFDNTQSGEAVMEVTAGCITRIGNIVSYNNRFHYYNSTKYHVIQRPTTSSSFLIKNTEGQSGSNPTADYPKWICYAKFEEGWRLIDKIYNISTDVPCDFIYPMVDVKQLAFVRATYDGSYYVGYTEMFYVDMKNSSAYNYSFAFDVTPEVLGAEDATEFGSQMKEIGQYWDSDFDYDAMILMEREINAINVSEPRNPYAFMVKQSYSFGGEVIDMATSYIPISSMQIGQYPLTVFTTSGVFTMEQGSGSTLYGNVVPLQPHVAQGKAVASPYGIFFVSSNVLYLLVGREVTNVSDILEGELELNIRENDAYKKLCCNNRGVFYDFSPLLSSEDFENFIQDATLTYDQRNNELIISNDECLYSYVLNLIAKTYHKIARRYQNPQNGARYVVEITGDTTNIVDLHTEEKGKQPILLQTRPMPLDIMYSHIQRLILMVDTKLKDEQNLCLSVFASDNLYDWKCVISAQKCDTMLRQIRSNKAAKSYKDYVILINGTVDTSTDISELIADYTVVNRRLG